MIRNKRGLDATDYNPATDDCDAWYQKGLRDGEEWASVTGTTSADLHMVPSPTSGWGRGFSITYKAGFRVGVAKVRNRRYVAEATDTRTPSEALSELEAFARDAADTPITSMHDATPASAFTHVPVNFKRVTITHAVIDGNNQREMNADRSPSNARMVTMRLADGGYITVWANGMVQVSDSNGNRSSNYQAETGLGMLSLTEADA